MKRTRRGAYFIRTLTPRRETYFAVIGRSGAIRHFTIYKQTTKKPFFPKNRDDANETIMCRIDNVYRFSKRNFRRLRRSDTSIKNVYRPQTRTNRDGRRVLVIR